MADDNLSEITWSDIGICLAAYVGWIALVLTFAATTERGAKIFGMFTSSLLRISIALSVLTLVGALALFYLDVMASVVVGGMLLAALFAVGYFFATRHHADPSRRLTLENALTVVALLLYLLVPAALTLWKRDDMSATVAGVVSIGVALFWGLGLCAYWFKTDFATEVNPFGKTATLLLLLCVSMWMLLYSAGDWAISSVMLLSFMAFVILAVYRHDRLLSMSLGAHQRHPTTTAFIVGTTVFCAAMSLTLALTKDQQDKSDDVFTLTVLMAVIAAMWLIGVIVFNALTEDPDAKVEELSLSELAAGAARRDEGGLDVFATGAWKRKLLHGQDSIYDAHVPKVPSEVLPDPPAETK